MSDSSTIEKNNAGKYAILPIFLIIFLDMIGFGIIIPLLAPLLLDPTVGLLPGADLAARTFMLGLMVSIYPLAQFFGAPILGGLSDRSGRKKVLIISLAGTLLGYILFAVGIMANNIWLLLFSRALAGFTGGNISIAFSAIADISDAKSKAKNFGFIGMAFGFGFIIGPFIGGKLADPSLVSWFDFATPFWFAAILSLLNIFLVMKLFKETSTTRVNSKLSLMTGFKNIEKAFHLPDLRAIFLVIFLITFGFTFFTQFFSVYLIERFNFTQGNIGDLFAYIGIWIAIAQGVVMRPVSSRFSPEAILKFSILALAIILLIMLVPQDPIYLYVIIPFMAIVNGLTFPTYTAIVSNLSGKESQGEIMGINQSIQSLGMAIPPLIAGVIAAMDITFPLIAASGITFIAWIIFVLFYRKKKPEIFHEV